MRLKGTGERSRDFGGWSRGEESEGGDFWYQTVSPGFRLVVITTPSVSQALLQTPPNRLSRDMVHLHRKSWPHRMCRGVS